jgi:hypothetical protein
VHRHHGYELCRWSTKRRKQNNVRELSLDNVDLTLGGNDAVILDLYARHSSVSQLPQFPLFCQDRSFTLLEQSYGSAFLPYRSNWHLDTLYCVYRAVLSNRFGPGVRNSSYITSKLVQGSFTVDLLLLYVEPSASLGTGISVSRTGSTGKNLRPGHVFRKQHNSTSSC